MTKTLLRFIIWSAKWIVLVGGYWAVFIWAMETYVSTPLDNPVPVWDILLGVVLGLGVIHLVALPLGAIYKRLPKGTGVPSILFVTAWTIKWISKLFGKALWWVGILTIPLLGIGFVLIMISWFFKDDYMGVPDFCNALMEAIKEDGVKTSLDAAELHLARSVPIGNNRIEAIPSDDTMQVPGDLGYPSEYVMRDRWLARFYCPRCGAYNWFPEFDSSHLRLAEAALKCKWCRADMIPVKVRDPGKPVILPEQIREYRNSTTGEGKTKIKRSPPA